MWVYLNSTRQPSRPPPSASGPSVSTVQYTMLCCSHGRARRTPQMLLKVRSTVAISISEVAPSITMPAAVSFSALSANWRM
ncbi:hypothetical protein D3C85_997930 [compost metagenome]